MMQMTSYSHHNLILIKETYPEILVKMRHSDVILRHMTSFSYIFPYYDVISKRADIRKNNDVIRKVNMEYLNFSPQNLRNLLQHLLLLNTTITYMLNVSLSRKNLKHMLLSYFLFYLLSCRMT